MDLTNKKFLSKARIKQAKDFLKDAKILIVTGGYKTVANRSYYAIFHAMRAVLAFDGIDRKKHSALISEFRKCYILRQKYLMIICQTSLQNFFTLE